MYVCVFVYMFMRIYVSVYITNNTFIVFIKSYFRSKKFSHKTNRKFKNAQLYET